MDILKIAIASGMLVTLDGRIGTEEYRSVHGSLQALRNSSSVMMVAGMVMIRVGTEKRLAEKGFIPLTNM